MTISTEPELLSYDGDDATVAFPVTWNYFAKSHVVATHRDANEVESTWVLDTDYTLTDAGLGGGTLTATVAPATGETIVIDPSPPNTQEKDLPIGGAVPTPQIEEGLDLAAMRDAKLQVLLNRTMRVPVSDPQVGNLTFPAVNIRASKYFGFDANGLPVAMSPPIAIEGAQVVTTLAAMQALTPVAGAYVETLYRTTEGDGGGGSWHWSAADQTAGVTNDPAKGVFVAPSSDTSGASGCWIRLYSGEINSRWFGATGLGVLSDSAQLTAFSTFGGIYNKSLYVPDGTYLQSSRWTIPYGLHLRGDGVNTIFKTDSTVTRFLPILFEHPTYLALPGVVARDFCIDGDGKGMLNGGLIQFNNCDTFVADRLLIKNGGTDGEAAPSGVNGIGVSAGAVGGAPSRGTIRDCTIQNTTKSSINWTGEARNGLIIGNHCRNSGLTGSPGVGTPGIQINGGFDGTVTGNFCYDNTGVGIYAATSGLNDGPKNLIITDNHCYNNGTATEAGHGIAVVNAYAAREGRLIIRGNHCYDNGNGAINSLGILLENENNILVQGNFTRGNAGPGIQVSSCENVEVSHNICEDDYVVSSSAACAISILNVGNTSKNITISNNKLINTATGIQNYGINVLTDNIEDLTILDNDITGMLVQDMYLAAFAVPLAFHLRHKTNVQATAATWYDALQFLAPDNSAYTVTATMSGTKSDGTDRAGYKQIGTLYRNGGAMTVQGAITALHIQESNAAWDAQITTNANAGRIRMLGLAATTINWTAAVEVIGNG